MDNFDWQPGEEGKGVVDDNGYLHTWNSNVEYPSHDEFVKDHPELGTPKGYFTIDPHGEFEVINPSFGYDRAKWKLMTDYIKEVHPDLHPAEPDTWSFG